MSTLSYTNGYTNQITGYNFKNNVKIIKIYIDNVSLSMVYLYYIKEEVINMTMAKVDYYYESISMATTRETLSSIKRAIDRARDCNDLTPVMFKGLNHDLRSRADWLRGRK